MDESIHDFTNITSILISSISQCPLFIYLPIVIGLCNWCDQRGGSGRGYPIREQESGLQNYVTLQTYRGSFWGDVSSKQRPS